MSRVEGLEQRPERGGFVGRLADFEDSPSSPRAAVSKWRRRMSRSRTSTEGAAEPFEFAFEGFPPARLDQITEGAQLASQPTRRGSEPVDPLDLAHLGRGVGGAEARDGRAQGEAIAEPPDRRVSPAGFARVGRWETFARCSTSWRLGRLSGRRSNPSASRARTRIVIERGVNLVEATLFGRSRSRLAACSVAFIEGDARPASARREFSQPSARGSAASSLTSWVDEQPRASAAGLSRVRERSGRRGPRPRAPGSRHARG